MAFMPKQLSKEIMKRSRLLNNFLSNKTDDNPILNVKELTDIKMFWKTVKALHSDKSCIRDRISISEKGEILKTEAETAEALNDFFSNIVQNSNISRYSELDSVAENITEPTRRAILKYKDHPSILAI